MESGHAHGDDFDSSVINGSKVFDQKFGSWILIDADFSIKKDEDNAVTPEQSLQLHHLSIIVSKCESRCERPFCGDNSSRVMLPLLKLLLPQHDDDQNQNS